MEGCLDEFFITVGKAVKESIPCIGQTEFGFLFFLVMLLAQEQGACHRHKGDGNHQRGDQGVTNGEGQALHELTYGTGGEGDGQEYRNSCQGRCRYRHGNFFCAGFRRFFGVISPFVILVDAVQYNDGVIYQHPDTDGQTTHGNNVQAHARQIHEGKGRHDGCRNGHGNDTGCDRALQEYQQYEECDDGTEEGCLCNVGNGKLDIFCCILYIINQILNGTATA